MAPEYPYFPVAGSHLASAWITLDPLPEEECLEFIAGSHLKTMYDGFSPAQPDDPLRSPWYPQLRPTPAAQRYG